MRDDTIVWIIISGLAALIVILALRLGRGFSARSKYLELEVKEPTLKEKKVVSVAEDAILKEVKTKDIAGIKIEGEAPIYPGENIGVFKRGVAERSNICGDIAGVKIQASPVEE